MADGIPDEGTLIYVKAGIHGDEPEDISIYAKTNEAFPHESQFESYRQLGSHIGTAVFDNASIATRMNARG
ncbi:MAG: hypothetical protein WA624_24060 [Methylocella sp.]